MINLNSYEYDTLTLTELDRSFRLNQLAHNIWWDLGPGSPGNIFELSPRGWQNLYHNAVAVMREVSDYELRVRLQDRIRPSRALRPQVVRELSQRPKHLGPSARPGPPPKSGRRISPRNSAFTNAAHRGGRPWHPRPATTQNPRAISVSVSLASVFFNREGYFQQSINAENWQTNITRC